MNTYGLTKKEYISLLKECGMCTKKWTIAKWKMFNEKRLELLHNKKNKKSMFGKKSEKNMSVKKERL